jgi:hypothetical protein
MGNTIFSETSEISYVYINANEGQSSGGHSGLKIGSYFYHFQYYNDKIFHLVREKWTEFLYVYNSSDNRRVQKIDLSLPQGASNQISSFWNEFYLIQKKQLEIKDFLQRDMEILEALQNQKEILIPGMAYFDQGTTKNLPFSKNKFNNFILSKKIKSVLWELNKIQYKPMRDPILNKEGYPRSFPFYSQLILDLLQKKQALECLLSNCNLSMDSFFLLDPYLKEGEKEKIIRLWKQYHPLLERKIQDHLSDSNEISGRSLLITVLRYKYMDHSLKTNSLWLPDLYPNAVGSYTFHKKEKEMQEEIQKQFHIFFSNQMESILNSKSISEVNLQALEDSANRYHDFVFHKNNSLPIRSYDQLLLPLKEKKVQLRELREDSETFSDSFKISQDAYAQYEKKLQNLYPFDLFTENCTTEVFTNLHRNLEEKDEEITKMFGGKLSEKENFNFIPFVAFRNVKQIYRIKQEETIQSFRIRSIQEMKKNKSSFWVEIRESNTLTSKIYKANRKDSLFIFFTDKDILLRPLYGTINLIAGVSQMSFGILTSPWDNGETLKAGGTGILFSLPELFFFNIRKGTFVNSEEYQKIFFRDKENE